MDDPAEVEVQGLRDKEEQVRRRVGQGGSWVQQRNKILLRAEAELARRPIRGEVDHRRRGSEKVVRPAKSVRVECQETRSAIDPSVRAAPIVSHTGRRFN